MRKYMLYQKVIDSINKTEWYRNDNFLKKLLNRGFSENQVEILKSMVEELTDIFEDRFHLEIIIENTNYLDIARFNLIIHYSKLTIMNEDGQSITINNHFQQIQIVPNTDNYTINYNLNCITVNPTTQQFLRGYNHSHTSGKNYGNGELKRFCLGNTTEFKKLISEFNSNLYDSDIFHMFCINLITMAETESLAGKPHVRMATISISGDLSSDRLPHYFIEGYMNKYENETTNAVAWKVTSGVLEVIDNDKFEQHCLIFEDDIEKYFNIGSIIVCKDSIGNYYRYTDDDQTSNIEIENIDWYFQFKNEKYQFGLANGAILKPETFFIHPQIKKHVKKHLEEKANIRLITESITKI